MRVVVLEFLRRKTLVLINRTVLPDEVWQSAELCDPVVPVTRSSPAAIGLTEIDREMSLYLDDSETLFS